MIFGIFPSAILLLLQVAQKTSAGESEIRHIKELGEAFEASAVPEGPSTAHARFVKPLAAKKSELIHSGDKFDGETGTSSTGEDPIATNAWSDFMASATTEKTSSLHGIEDWTCSSSSKRAGGNNEIESEDEGLTDDAFVKRKELYPATPPSYRTGHEAMYYSRVNPRSSLPDYYRQDSSPTVNEIELADEDITRDDEAYARELQELDEKLDSNLDEKNHTIKDDEALAQEYAIAEHGDNWKLAQLNIQKECHELRSTSRAFLDVPVILMMIIFCAHIFLIFLIKMIGAP
ncbi:hypothetical protein PTTG_12021 [Puccinia triticina 1-1 BBBD Race 1]|uniref:Uncharacterized protein n=2 Tax=Puccinia triticina TaxID=208348 RepID=A0A180GVG2_PUCT1|nr:uncharacterized protein PtA15_10A239 [Puccinia triticina]OAV95983.1 hypothetical protein PTTG_12021 [Puccinia triticina 1-1 BBBD Race 1]WAQ88819.1 hypothetical protein PtA15_10A239 [Puccinia triticina]WAR58880.1 hypothetical protein PtB15_10B219 [Puccinia triticina]